MVVGLSAVAVFEAALNLKLIAVRRCFLSPFHRAEEDAAVQLVAVGDRFKLEEEVARRLFRFEEASSTRHMDRALFHCELALPTGDFAPALERRAIEQRLRAEWLEIDVAELNLATVHLQANVSGLKRLVGRVGEVENRLAVHLHDDLRPCHADVVRVPFAATDHRRLGLGSLHEATRVEARRMRIAHVQFIAIDSRIGRLQRRSQEDAAVASLRKFEVAAKFIVREATRRAEQPRLSFLR